MRCSPVPAEAYRVVEAVLRLSSGFGAEHHGGGGCRASTGTAVTQREAASDVEDSGGHHPAVDRKYMTVDVRRLVGG